MPTAYSILFLLIIVVAIATWFVPAGEYDIFMDQSGVEKPISGTYHQVESEAQTIGDVLLAAFRGFYDAVDICLFILAVGGFLGVMMKTGAVNAGIFNIVRLLKGREMWMIPILMVLFGLGGTTFGMAEETIAFYPLLIPVFVMAGYDTLTAAAVILLGAGMGVIGSTVNPFATGIASGFAGISIGEGIGIRLLMLVLLETLAILFVLRYARMVKHDPEKSIVYKTRLVDAAHFAVDQDSDIPVLTAKRKVVLALFALTFLVMIYGVIPFADLGIHFIPTLGWGFTELSALFLVGAVVVGIVYRLREADIADSFVAGAADLLGVALIIAISRGITVVMNDGMITATILHAGEEVLATAGSVTFSVLSYVIYLLFSFLIPSSSGLATLSIPIMAPLGEFAGVASSLIVTAFQSASGLVNLVTPTSAILVGGLAMARVSYVQWLRFVWPFLLVIFGISIGILILFTIL
ncbi:MAG: YfcC family protein [Firmicutes bacterium]|nr:YfcC family protein [Bacillota bacterium]